MRSLVEHGRSQPDEIVVAGLSPTRRRNSPFDANHRGNSLILMIDLAILSYIVYLLSGAIAQNYGSLWEQSCYLFQSLDFIQYGLATEEGKDGLIGQR